MTALIRKYFPKWVKSSTRSRHTREKRVEAKSVFLLKSKQLTIVIVSITTIALVLISFLGQAPSGPGVSIDQLARIQVSAELPFAYESRIQTNRKIDLARKQVPPIYTVNYEHFSEYEVFINQLNDLILDFSRNNRNLPKNQQETKLAEALNEFVTNSEFTIDVRSFLTLYRETDFWGRYRLLQQGLTELWYIYKEGIFAQKTQLGMSRDYFSVVKITDSRGNTREVNAKSTNEALLDLRVRLSKLEKTEVIYQSLFEIMKEGIVVNLFYNETEHTKAIEAVTSKIAPVKIEIEKGDVIIELGTIVTARDMEKLNAYDLERRKLAKSAPLLGFYMLERIFFTLVVLGISITLIIVTFPENDRSNKHYLMCALMVTVNMIAIRLMLELGESNLFSETNTFSSLLIYAPPFLLAPLVINILLGVIPGILTSLIIAGIYTMMQGKSIEMFFIILLSSMVGIILSNKVRVRSKILKASFFSGITLALALILQSLVAGESPTLIIQRTLLVTILSLVYGMLIVGIVPILESVFKISSDITLLELTDFNHPLLRKMQMVAPGTYHHSLMVANLSEKAAGEIGANALLCRTCSYFHDIGKMTKPEYFTENQTVGSVSPHDSMKPSMSALVIKNHVSEGVDMARKYSLPKVIIDVIRQHHGTSLIRYFYFQAVNEAKSKMKDKTKLGSSVVEQSNYRYDGPSPLFKESAIIFLADSVEAASRSLKKVNQQSIEELIDSIIATAISDHQLDKSPLSYQELAKIRSSFTMSILNMLHSRIEYPKPESESE